MGPVIGQILPYALGIAISVLPIIAIILMLITPKAASNGLAFLAGWVAGLTVVGAVLLALADAAGVSTSAGPSTAASVVKLVLGVGLLFLAIRQWRGRPKAGEEPKMPAWMSALDMFTPVKAFGLAALLSGVNPKNLLLNAAAMTTIAQAGLVVAQQVVALLVVVVIGSLTIVAPVIVYFAAGKRAHEILGDWKVWLTDNNSTVMAVLLLVIGVMLVGQGLAGLT